MTTKRFTILYGLDEDPFDWDILDNEKDAIICQYNGTPICELLNELHEENKQLKKQIGNLKHTRDFADEVCADCERLEHKNKQLKCENELLRNTIEMYDGKRKRI